MSQKFDVVGLVVGAALPACWKGSPKQRDAIVSTDHSLSDCACIGHHTCCPESRHSCSPEGHLAQEEEWYGGHFICESVTPEARHTIIAAPMLRGVVDRIAMLDTTALSPAGARAVLETVVALARAAQMLADSGKAVRALPQPPAEAQP